MNKKLFLVPCPTKILTAKKHCSDTAKSATCINKAKSQQPTGKEKEIFALY